VAGGAGVLTAVAAGTAEDTAEVAEDTPEDAADDTALPAVCAAGTGEEDASWVDPGKEGSCAALTGRAKITVRMRPNTKVTASAPQA
jgi:hypothetical protein